MPTPVRVLDGNKEELFGEHAASVREDSKAARRPMGCGQTTGR